MLGKLFNLTSPGAPGVLGPASTAHPKPISSLESVQEDIHTRNLLYPDAQALFQHRHDQVFPLSTSSVLPANAASAFDYNGDVDLDVRDVRVIIMQDALGGAIPSLLYDSQPPPPSPTPLVERFTSHTTFQDARRNPTSPRKSSVSHSSRPLVIQPDSPQLRQGAFDRRPSFHGRAHAVAETEAQRSSREYVEELATFSSCIFANSDIMAYKGTSTKVHVIPSDNRGTELSSSYVGDGRGSIGRSGMRSSKLAQSYSSDTMSPVTAAAPFPTSSAAPLRPADKKKVLITRLFPVNLPSGDVENPNPASSQQGRFSEDTGGYPFPQPDEMSPKKKKPQPKQKKTPMYAVALIVNLPPAPSQSLLSTSTNKSNFRGPGSYTDQDSFPSSFSSSRRSGWTMVGPGLGAEPVEAYNTDIEDRIDVITQHWDIIMRTLTHLQSIVAAIVFTRLRQIDLNSPDPYPVLVSSTVARTGSLSGRRFEDSSQVKPVKTNAKIVTLAPYSLAESRRIMDEVEAARGRIVAGLRATRVVTGQGRWGIWREEARWMVKWAGGREHDFFFNVLTGFLATHTDWLQALSPVWYRKRFIQQQKNKSEEDLSVPSRTLVVAHDKMVARRLLFLLSAFLPANQHFSAVNSLRPSTSASAAPFSQSPPSYMGFREEPLRRRMKSQKVPRRVSHSRTASTQAPSIRSIGVPPTLAHLSMDVQHERRSSDLTPMRPTNLSIPGSELVSRKSSAATTTTIMPEPSRPHFSTMHRRETSQSLRPGSSGSLAADDLKRSLKRGDSAGQASFASNDSRSQGSRWGSVISGFWGSKRRDSTSAMDATQVTLDSQGSNPPSPTKSRDQKTDKLTEMVKEVQITEPPTAKLADTDNATLRDYSSPVTPRQASSDQDSTPQESFIEPTNTTPEPTSAFDSPVKTTILDDGVIDVDVPFPDFVTTSFETAVSSPSSSGYLSTPGFMSGFEAFEQFSRIAGDGDSPLNAAGWLQSYHPDFALQAIPAQNDLIEQVKTSLRAEPSPKASQSSSNDLPFERWVDVSSALIADTTTLTVIRIRYRRLIRPKLTIDKNGMLLSGSVNVPNPALLTPSIMPSEPQLQEEFLEETIGTFDPAFVEAVERVILQSGDMSKDMVPTGIVFSPTHNVQDQAHIPEPGHGRDSPSIVLEVPRGECKAVVLQALSDIAREEAELRERALVEGGESSDARGPQNGPLREAVRHWMHVTEMGE